MSDTYFDLPSRLGDTFADIENDIVNDLRESNSDYAELREQISDLKQKNPFIDKVLNGTGEIQLTEKEHAELIRYLRLKFKLDDMERLQIYFRGHTDAVAYFKKIKAI